MTDRLALTSLQLQGYRRRKAGTSVGDVHVLEAEGNGPLPPLVLLHGFSSAAVHFYPLLGKLRPHVRRLILPDMPGHGFSDAPAAGISAERLKIGLIEALEAVLDEPAVVFGNSMGGIGAIHYALARPEQVRGLLLCSPSGAAMDEEELARFVGTFQFRSHAEALSFMDRVLVRPSPVRQILAWALRRKFSHRNMVDLLASITPDDFLRPEQVRSLKPPVLLVWGQEERILPASHLAFFRQHLPDHARVLTPQGFGHAPFMDDAKGLADTILSFLGEISRPGRGLAPPPATNDLSREPRHRSSRSGRQDPQERAPGSWPR
jgi:pimeloyl-ACP methyl ester carboxylesterase